MSRLCFIHDSPDSLDPTLLRRVLQRAASAAFICQLCQEHKLRFRRGVYSLMVVVCLMIYQRLNNKRTLSSAVPWLAHYAPSLPEPSKACKRVREDRISTRTGGYCQARQKLPH